MTTPARARRDAGFTLIEVLVAVAIVAVSLAAGSRAASSVIDTSQRLSDVTLGQWCADNELTELRLTDQLPAVGTTAFACSELGRDFKGTLKTQFENVDRTPEDLRDGFYALDCRKSAVVVLEAVTHALPDDVIEGDWLLRCDDLLPGAIAFGDGDGAFDPGEDVVFGIEDLGGESA